MFVFVTAKSLLGGTAVCFFFSLTLLPLFSIAARLSATAPPKMMAEAVDVVSQVADNAQLIASSVSDNGGYFFPVAGLGSLGAIILYLAPPLADE